MISFCEGILFQWVLVGCKWIRLDVHGSHFNQSKSASFKIFICLVVMTIEAKYSSKERQQLPSLLILHSGSLFVNTFHVLQFKNKQHDYQKKKKKTFPYAQ